MPSRTSTHFFISVSPPVFSYLPLPVRFFCLQLIVTSFVPILFLLSLFSRVPDRLVCLLTAFWPESSLIHAPVHLSDHLTGTTCTLSPLLFFFAAEDPYYCGLQARVPNFAVRPRKVMPAAGVPASGHYSSGGGGGGNENSALDAGMMMQRSSRMHHNQHQRSSSQHAGPASQLEIRKSQSSGYLNTLFNQSSSLFSSKKLDPQNKRNSASFNSNPYSDSSLGKNTHTLFFFHHSLIRLSDRVFDR